MFMFFLNKKLAKSFFIRPILLLSIASTMFVKQHYFLDVASGILVGWCGFEIFKISNQGRKAESIEANLEEMPLNWDIGQLGKPVLEETRLPEKPVLILIFDPGMSTEEQAVALQAAQFVREQNENVPRPIIIRPDLHPNLFHRENETFILNGEVLESLLGDQKQQGQTPILIRRQGVDIDAPEGDWLKYASVFTFGILERALQVSGNKFDEISRKKKSAQRVGREA